MKKCPTCSKTFDDNMKFCQADGTPLVEDQPPEDPYKTMVANQADLKIPNEEEKVEAEDGVDASEAPPEVSEPEPKSEVSDVAEKPEPGDGEDPLRTVIAGVETSASVDVDLPDEEISAEEAIENLGKAASPPDPPKFDAPEVAPPEFTGALEDADADEGVDVDAKEDADAPPPSPFSEEEEKADSPSAPIPSPFDKSMPPGYAPPSTPPFDPSEPVKAEKVGSVDPKVAEAGASDDWSPPPAPMEEWKDKEIGSNTPFEPPAAAADGQNSTLAIVSLVLGILSMTLCCGPTGLLMGPAGAVIGFMARNKAIQNPEEFGGGGLATGGIITGVIGFLVGILVVIYYIFLFTAG